MAEHCSPKFDARRMQRTGGAGCRRGIWVQLLRFTVLWLPPESMVEGLQPYLFQPCKTQGSQAILGPLRFLASC